MALVNLMRQLFKNFCSNIEKKVLEIQFGYIHLGIPDVQDQEKNTAHVYHSAKLSPCVEVQLKIAEKQG